MTTVDALQLRRYLGRKSWGPPVPYGPDGWKLLAHVDGFVCSIVVSTAYYDGAEWTHASRTGPGRVPTYAEMVSLHHAVWGDEGYSYQVQAPAAQHVNFHEHALHLWGRADGRPVLPEFGRFGMI